MENKHVGIIGLVDGIGWFSKFVAIEKKIPIDRRLRSPIVLRNNSYIHKEIFTGAPIGGF